MFASAVVYAGLVTAFLVLVALAGLALPAPEKGLAKAATHLDAFFPRWQFSEHHEARVAAPPHRVFEAVRAVRADEILFFRFLTWIRRGGRDAPENILNPGTGRPLLDVATSSGFVSLADDPPREVVVGTVVIAPPGPREKPAPEMFANPFPPGFAVAGMNFLVTPDGNGGSIVTTETRVYASSASARRRFAAYWRVIYPGSALIRRMWLRAIVRRAGGG